ncbi:hypothetical protein [Streptomyces sp. BRA346]|uniref:hypothetical protein n=1 Tax=Streptomyces sp. BRA346 TaxID=2878199 RepID=UPI004064281D
MTAAYARTGLAPAGIDHVEAHGTGTPLGDPIEAGAPGAVLGAGRDPPALASRVRDDPNPYSSFRRSPRGSFVLRCRAHGTNG